MREAFEQAIVDNPEAASSAAYGDWLAGQGDPRGQFIQVPLALEDPACRGKRRREMQAREEPPALPLPARSPRPPTGACGP
jgi:uncharacterized protein (TIGR02996 family)